MGWFDQDVNSPLDDIFDFDRDGKLNLFEQSAKYEAFRAGSAEDDLDEDGFDEDSLDDDYDDMDRDEFDDYDDDPDCDEFEDDWDRTEDETLAIGDRVTVPATGPKAEGTVVSVGRYLRVAAPYPPERTKMILGEATE